MDTRFTETLAKLAPIYIDSLASAGRPIPKNRGTDMKARYLDCALINWSLGEMLPPLSYQSVRCGFCEGGPVYSDGAGCETAILHQSHIQIAVRDPACIIGTFRPSG